jgi:hypothetical protein
MTLAMRLPSFALSLLLFCVVAGAVEPVGYRSFVAPDAVQSDLKGRVKVVREKTSEWDGGKLETTSERESVYDLDGYLAESRDTDVTEGTTETMKRFYDAQGNLIAEEETSGGRTVSKTVRILPEHKRVVWETEDKGRRNVVEETTFDRFGKEGEIREFDKKGNLQNVYLTRRDARGLETEVVFRDARGNPETIIQIVWDERGFAIQEETDQRREKFVVKSTFEYPEVDGQGNWTKRTAKNVFFEKGRETLKTEEVTVRAVEYHPKR